MSSLTMVRIQDDRSRTPLSAAQKKFNGLVQKIEIQKRKLALWQEAIARGQKRVAGELAPLAETFRQHQAEMVAWFDHLYSTQKFTPKQQEKIAHLISRICEELIRSHDRADLKPLYHQYSGFDFDAEQQEEESRRNYFARDRLEEAFGAPLDEDFDFSDPQMTAEYLTEKLEEQQQQAQAKRAQQKQTAKQKAKEAKKQEEEAGISKSIRAVYRQLVAALHPDREPDPDEQKRKTDLMQKVTVAYSNQDLLQLLELQLQVEQIDQAAMNHLADDRLKHFNKVLQNQLDELRDELLMLEMRLMDTAGFAPYEPFSPARYEGAIHQDILGLKQNVNGIRQDLDAFKDLGLFKQWINRYRIPAPDFDRGFF